MIVASHYFRSLITITVLLMLCLGSAPATASSLNFVPSNATLLPGESIDVEVFFTDPDSSFVGAFDFFVNYDPGILMFDPNNVTFGTGLAGDPIPFQSVSEDPDGKVNFIEVSTATDLSTLQNGTDDLFLFSMTFTADQIGPSELTFSESISPPPFFLGDESGDIIELDATGIASINVVPIPGSGLLMLFGLAGVYGMKRKKRQ